MTNAGNTAKESYKAAVEKDKRIQALRKRIEDGLGTYSDVDALASRSGQHAGRAIVQQFVAEASDGLLESDVALSILQPTMAENYTMVADLTEIAQRSINRKAGIGVTPVRPKLNQERINGLAAEIAEADDVAALSPRLISQIENASMSIVDDSVSENMEFQHGIGRNPKIIRKAEAKCCEWCADLEGEYDYEDVKRGNGDVYRRHDNCRCTVEFDPGTGERQNVHTKRIVSKPDVEKRKDIIKNLSKQSRLGPQTASPRITNLRNEKISYSVGAKFRNYDIMDLATGEIYHLAEGSILQDKEVFAGKGSSRPYFKAQKYAERYGGREEDWQHVKGKGLVSTKDGDRKAEIHWSQCDGIGKVEMFIKKWID